LSAAASSGVERGGSPPLSHRQNHCLFWFCGQNDSDNDDDDDDDDDDYENYD
jgi:hypothetical protein